ncbi:EF-P beta-lysylation protein EpmB [Acidihalobacter prosperus]
MITLTPQPIQNPDDNSQPWRHALQNAIRDPGELMKILELPEDLVSELGSASRTFPLLVPRGFVARMRPGDPNDPLLLQVLPLAIENRITPGFIQDPVGDMNSLARPGVLHKYKGRVLLITTGACAIHCRYCFRRHFPYTTSSFSRSQWSEIITYLETHDDIDEIILSGGDPLVLDNKKLSELAYILESFKQIKRLRVHTRLPIVLPERIDKGLLAWIKSSRLQIVFVIHGNHANEFDNSVQTALRELQKAGATLFNQSVLLRNINDNVKALYELSIKLFEYGVIPYYLHLLDPVAGASHFEVSEHSAKKLMRQLRNRLPGYLVPKLVREEPGQPAKTDIPL